MENKDDVYNLWFGIVLVLSMFIVGILAALQVYGIISETSWKFMFFGVIALDVMILSIILYKANLNYNKNGTNE